VPVGLELTVADARVELADELVWVADVVLGPDDGRDGGGGSPMEISRLYELLLTPESAGEFA
jgi:hypothetical protein